ncbi:MAG: amino acid adenylation domain-containing protein [Verrucomicrobium sp.]
MQSAMLFHSLRSPGLGAYVQQFIIKLHEPLDVARFESAWRHVIKRHEVLRTRICTDSAGNFVQYFTGQAELEFEIRDLRYLSKSDQTKQIEEFLATDRRQGFDIANGNLSRFHLLVLGEVLSQFVWTSHHAILDGRSRREVLQEVFAIYDVDESTPSRALKERPSFTEHLQWMQQREVAGAKRFWRELLAGLDQPAVLNFGFAQQNHSDPTQTTGRHQMLLDEELTSSLKALGNRLDVTLNTLLQGAWAILLSRYTGCEDIVFGAVRACRQGGLPHADKVIGPLLNTVPVRIICNGDETPLADWLKGVRAQWVAMRTYEHLPLALIQEESPLDPGVALFESLVSFENHHLTASLRKLGPAFSRREFELQASTHYPLVLSGYGGSELLLEIVHDRTRFGDFTASEILRHLTYLLRQFAEQPTQYVSKFRLLPPDCEAGLLGKINPPGDVLNEVRTLAQIFADNAAEHPESVALDDGTHSLSYRELAARAGRLTDRLRAVGLAQGDRIAISADRTMEVVISMIAVLNLGGVYVPLDPTEPRERLLGMLSDSGVQAVLASEAHWHIFSPDEERRWKLLSHDDALAQTGPTEIVAAAPGQFRKEEVACVLYTSGSTGRPKGICIKHASIASLVLKTNYTNFTREDVVAQAANCCFDAATFEIWGALLNGARLSLISREKLLQADDLEQEITRRGITVLFLTTGLCHELVRQKPGMFRCLRQLVVGGEVLRPEIASQVMAHGPPVRFTNGYGPTETTTFAAFHDVLAYEDWTQPLPIGRPISRARVYVLDKSLRALPAGIPGELYIGGNGVSEGYLNHPDLTAEKFVADPFVDGAILYRTGDWGRIRQDGELDFLGRKDGQAKIRGHRVEVGEIESALARHPAVQEGVVTIQGPEGDVEQTHVIGHVVFHPGSKATAGELKAFLRILFPEYLVPSHFYVRDKFPLNRNGKVDRRSLTLTPGASLPNSQAVDSPQTPTEKTLHRLWRDLLRLPNPGINEDFFELGGNSLSATRLLVLVEQEFGIRLTPATFFTRCTIKELSLGLDQRAGQRMAQPSPFFSHRAPAQSWPLCSQQDKMWQLGQEHPSLGVWNITRVLRMRGTLDVAALKSAFQAVSQRHDALRTTIHCEDGSEPVQVVADSRQIDVQERDVSSLSEQEQLSLVSRTAKEEGWRPLDLGDIVIRVILLKLGTGHHVLIVTTHHCVCDGTSLAVMLEDLGHFYSAYAKGEGPSLPSPPGQSVMFPASEREYLDSSEGRAAAEYWREFLRSLPAPVPLPTIASPTPQSDLRGNSMTRTLPRVASKKLRERAQQLRATPFSLLITAFAVLVYGITARDRFLILTPFSRRVAPWMHRVMGMFTNGLPVEFDLRGNITFSQLVERTRNRLVKTMEFQMFPSAGISTMAQQLPSWTAQQRALFQLDFIEVPPLNIEHCFHGVHATLEPVEHQTLRNELRILVFPSGDPIKIRFDYPAAQFEKEAVAQMMERFCQILSRVAEDPATSVADLINATHCNPHIGPPTAAES